MPGGLATSCARTSCPAVANCDQVLLNGKVRWAWLLTGAAWQRAVTAFHLAQIMRNSSSAAMLLSVRWCRPAHDQGLRLVSTWCHGPLPLGLGVEGDKQPHAPVTTFVFFK